MIFYNNMYLFNKIYKQKIIFGFGVIFYNVNKKYHTYTQPIDIILDKGKLYYSNGTTEYNGELKNNKKHGKGKLYYYTGGKRSNDLLSLDDNYDGYCKRCRLFDKKYNDEYCGRCVRDRFEDGWEIFGEKIDDNKIDDNKIYDELRIKYDGEFENDKIHGKGKYYNYNSNMIYEGEFRDDKKNGIGTLYYFDGTLRYEGEFKNGEIHGKGKLYNYDGTLEYEGEFDNDKKHGKGKYYNYKSVMIYEGEFKNDKKHGKGKLYNYDGTLEYDGKFENDEITNILYHFKKIIGYL